MILLGEKEKKEKAAFTTLTASEQVWERSMTIEEKGFITIGLIAINNNNEQIRTIILAANKLLPSTMTLNPRHQILPNSDPIRHLRIP